MTSETQKYNGWSNYETWLVNLWLDNDEGTHNHWRGAAYNTCQDADTKDEAKQAFASALEDQLSADASEAIGMAGMAGMFADLLGAALRSVDYQEMAEHWIADEWEDNEEEESENELEEVEA